MAKLKTKKAITKRFRLTKTGKVLRRPIGQDHHRSKKTGKQKRLTRKWVAVAPAEAKLIRKLLMR
ncbi:MAG: 50S ribosomal protein L35 [Candidatus Wildermuthbacteria bacterium]|nr:50S ribosomal protein L35 [Candidatus Wildermuthbacteria bacterium]